MAHTNSGEMGARPLNPGGGTGDEHNCVDNEEVPVVDDRDIDIADVQVVFLSLASAGHSYESLTGTEEARIASPPLQNTLTSC